MLTEAQYKALLQGELGELADVYITEFWTILWMMYVAYPAPIRYAYVKIALIDILLGQYWNKTTYTVGSQTLDFGKWFDNLYRLKELAMKEADRENALLVGGKAEVGLIRHTAPVMPPGYDDPLAREVQPEVIDANDLRYQGNPYSGQVRRNRLF
jgi:hypothetical protein